MSERKNKTVLRPYQRRWANDPARFAIAVKSAQIGYSTATAAWAVDRCLRTPKRNVIFLSRSERQALELGQKAKDWVDGYTGVAADYFRNEPFGETSMLQHEVKFGNGSRIIVLAANPDTARGYTGDVVLDEFAFHKDSQAIFTAVYRQVSLGFSMRILSTPNGQRGKFYEIAKSLTLETGLRPRRQPVKVTGLPWSGHWCDIRLAVEEGIKLDPEEVRAGCDEDTWLQEYCCQFISQASEWISPELYQQCTSSEASARFDGAADWQPRSLYGGWDVARNRDLSVVWISDLVGDVTWTRGVIEMRNTPTPDQIREARSLMPLVRRLVIDKGGMGLVIFEALEREFPGQVEGVQFTTQSKEAMAVQTKKRMEDIRLRVPDDDRCRQSFRSVKKSITQTGIVRFDAEHDQKFGHADHWWACCLAEQGATQPTYSLAHDGALIGKPITAGARNWVF
ncbi:MAG TPA: terminase family protein [Terriglobia bacterium]|nr:terminase family protein [Terriglobia bacterium]